jgi:hypothetical protein
VKALLVHPHGSNWMGSGKDISTIFNLMPPIGLLSIAAYLEEKGIPVEVMDCYGAPSSIEQHAADILARDPECWLPTTSSFLEGYAIADD